MESAIYETFLAKNVTKQLLKEAASLFSNHYGVWSELAPKQPGMSSFKSGTHVRLSTTRMRRDYLPKDISTYTRVTVDGVLAGHAFACRWKMDEKVVCWVTQLVVERNFRERGYATGLLSHLKEEEDDFYCIMSSQPASCMAAARAFGSELSSNTNYRSHYFRWH